MISSKDREILRELAKQVAEISADEINNERRQRGRDINSLRPCRPIVWIDEIPWHEMDIDGELICRCEDEEAATMEAKFRHVLYRWKHMQADMVVDDAYYIEKAFDHSGCGISVEEDILTVDSENHIVSHRYKDRLETAEQVAELRLPVVTARPETDKLRMEFASEVLDGILPVRLRGHGTYHAPWDFIPRLRGVEPILMDLIDRPDHIHAIRSRFKEIGESELTQMEEQGLLDFNIADIHCTPPYADGLPAADHDGKTRLKDCWFRAMAQMFSSVSPAMFKEFELDYVRPLMDKSGLVYYGCCEPLDTKLSLLMEIPNMRKIGVSPWSDQQIMAERMGGNYVFSRKPNPAFVTGVFDADAVRRETEETLELCLQYNCPCEFTLKDISTVSYKPQNLIAWAKTVTDTVARYY